jgi:hypothetical protein
MRNRRSSQAFSLTPLLHRLRHIMKPTDYDRIAEALGISAMEARELECEQRRWHAFVTNKIDSSSFEGRCAASSG